VDITFPKIGAKNRLVQMAKTNASEYLEKNIAKNEKEKAMTTGAVERLAEIFDIKTPTRIECFDISDISGTDKVASDVCFIDGKAEKSEYRRYKIKTVKGADDFASMKEVITRRLNKIDEGWPTPDLIVVDGGKGQLSVALEAMEECGKHVPVISLA
jgi:excinuclease ABC subunit C